MTFRVNSLSIYQNKALSTVLLSRQYLDAWNKVLIMKNNLLVLSIVFTLCGLGCEKQDKIEELEITGKRWNISEDIGKAFAIHVCDEYIIIRNDISDTKLTAVWLNHTKEIYNFGKWGAGPFELTNPGPIIAHSSSIDVFDGAKMSLLNFDLTTIRNRDSISVKTLFKTNVNGIISILPLEDSLYISSGVFPDGQLCLIDKNGIPIKYLGNYPSEIDNTMDIPFQILGMAYQSSMCKQPTQKRFALVTRYGEIIQIYEWDSEYKLANELYIRNNLAPKIATREINGTPNFMPDKDTRWGYISIDATDEYIFALYSGRLQVPENAFYAGNQIHVYDWNGKFIYKINVDYDLTSIAVKNKKIYALLENENIGNDIVEYDYNF